MKTKRHSLDLVVVVALFCLYTGSALILCAIGVQVYRDTADTMRRNFDDRTSILYISEKVRHYDGEDSIRIDKFKGSDALVLVEKRNDRVLETWLFVQDGVLYEGLFSQGTVPDIKLCQAILPMQSMEVRMLAASGSGGSGGGSGGTGGGSGGSGGSSGGGGAGSSANGQLISISFVATNGETNSIELWLRSAGKPGA